jgi:hypothetical protein
MKNGHRPEPQNNGLPPWAFEDPIPIGGRPVVVAIGNRRESWAISISSEQSRQLHQIAYDFLYANKPSITQLMRAIADGDMVVVPRHMIVNLDELWIIKAGRPPEDIPHPTDEFPP